MSKRAIDATCALLGLIVLSPLLVIVAVVVKLSSRGPIIFKQMRVGIHGVPFELYKFRTMLVSAPADVATHLLRDTEGQFTPLGRFLRKFSLDELPQMFNILKGDMSIVGPRPALWNQYDLIEERERFGANDVLPGLTGWAQVNGRDELTIAEKAVLDGYYVEHQGLAFDIKCILASISVALSGHNVREGTVSKSKRIP